MSACRFIIGETRKQLEMERQKQKKKSWNGFPSSWYCSMIIDQRLWHSTLNQGHVMIDRHDTALQYVLDVRVIPSVTNHDPRPTLRNPTFSPQPCKPKEWTLPVHKYQGILRSRFDRWDLIIDQLTRLIIDPPIWSLGTWLDHWSIHLIFDQFTWSLATP